MLLFEHLGAFQAAYECAKKLYPEIETIPIIVQPDEKISRVAVLEGTDEDKGKYKILIRVTSEKGMNAYSFSVGLAQIIFRVKYGNFVLDSMSDGNPNKVANDYNDIIDSITKRLNDIMFINNLIIE